MKFKDLEIDQKFRLSPDGPLLSKTGRASYCSANIPRDKKDPNARYLGKRERESYVFDIRDPPWVLCERRRFTVLAETSLAHTDTQIRELQAVGGWSAEGAVQQACRDNLYRACDVLQAQLSVEPTEAVVHDVLELIKEMINKGVMR